MTLLCLWGTRELIPPPWCLGGQLLRYRDIPALCWAVSGVIQRTRGRLSSALSLPKPIWGFPVSQHHIPGQVRRSQQAQVSFLRELPASDFYHCLPTQPGLSPSFQSRRLSSWLKSGETCSDTCIRIFDVIVVVFCALRVPPRPECLFSLSNLRKFVFKGINENFS